jgi:flagellar hook protein FlgE
MLESIYIGMTGLDSYSKGLNVISNNVANLNTTGFKGSQMQFADLYYKNSDAGLGSGNEQQQQVGTGVGTGGTVLNFQQGEARQTGNDLDLLIDGPGLFVLRKDGQTTYTRAGQFEFDKDGFMVDRVSGARVASLSGGALGAFSLSGLRASAPKATSSVKFSGNLSSGDQQHVISNVTVYDALGTPATLRITFDNRNSTTPGAWDVTVVTADGKPVGTGQIRMKDGKPEAGFDAVQLTVTPTDGQATNLTLDFSAEVNSFPAGIESTLAAGKNDGYPAGSLVKASFDNDGNFVTTYSNGQTDKHGRLALAWFSHTDALEQVGNNQYVNRFGQEANYGSPGDAEFGKVQAKALESSNVDLSQQFGEMIITQRGYQASSQVLTTANEMIQQLLDMRGKR